MRTWLFVSWTLAALLLAGCGRKETWADPERNSRMAVLVRANGFARVDRPVTITGEFPNSLRVVEVNERGEVLDDSVPFQLDYQQELTFLMKGETPADGARVYQLYLGEGERPEVRGVVTAKDNVQHQGQDTIVVTSPSGVYYYHKLGGGFASLIDGESKDWISYRPGGGSAGEYRGIPNIIHPEGGLHPGAETCESRMVADGPLMVRIRTRCHDGAWAAEWSIYPGYATLTVQKAAHPYWVLYEGTPGGQLAVETDYWVRSDGTREPVSNDWQGRLESPRWVYFGDANSERVLFLAQHSDDGDYDQFWQMEGNMTVFGFGREYKCCEKSLTKTPAEFTIGFVKSSEHDAVAAAIEGAYRNLVVSKGPVEQRGQQ